ncbi:hypothetical protein GGF32_007584 [Allomyces javanicus]|nr:hypothetical protein GGF32_007584 [Allomyces javanicus]
MWKFPRDPALAPATPPHQQTDHQLATATVPTLFGTTNGRFAASSTHARSAMFATPPAHGFPGFLVGPLARSAASGRLSPPTPYPAGTITRAINLLAPVPPVAHGTAPPPPPPSDRRQKKFRSHNEKFLKKLGKALKECETADLSVLFDKYLARREQISIKYTPAVSPFAWAAMALDSDSTPTTAAGFGSPAAPFGTVIAFGTPSRASWTPASVGGSTAEFGKTAAIGTSAALFGSTAASAAFGFGTQTTVFGTPTAAFGMLTAAFASPMAAFATPTRAAATGRGFGCPFDTPYPAPPSGSATHEPGFTFQFPTSLQPPVPPTQLAGPGFKFQLPASPSVHRRRLRGPRDHLNRTGSRSRTPSKPIDASARAQSPIAAAPAAPKFSFGAVEQRDVATPTKPPSALFSFGDSPVASESHAPASVPPKIDERPKMQQRAKGPVESGKKVAVAFGPGFTFGVPTKEGAVHDAAAAAEKSGRD